MRGLGHLLLIITLGLTVLLLWAYNPDYLPTPTVKALASVNVLLVIGLLYRNREMN